MRRGSVAYLGSHRSHMPSLGKGHQACLALRALSPLLSPRAKSHCGPSGRREDRG